jgi:hypothetical protein
MSTKIKITLSIVLMYATMGAALAAAQIVQLR